MFAEKDEVIFIVDAFEIVVKNHKNTIKECVPETIYKIDMVADDLLEALRVASRISKKTYFLFNKEDMLNVYCKSEDAMYSKEIMCESDMPLMTTLGFDSKELFELINSVEDDYIVLKFSEGKEWMIIEEKHSVMSIRSDVL